MGNKVGESFLALYKFCNILFYQKTSVFRILRIGFVFYFLIK